MTHRHTPLAIVDHVVAVGSVDGVCTAAAVLRLTGRPDEVGLVFTEAFKVDRIDPSAWPPARRVALVDLAVNDRDKTMTADFVRRIREAGHKIVAVIDEHSREDWRVALGNFDDLIIRPQSQHKGIFKSSGSVLQAYVGYGVDDHTRELLNAAANADYGNFATRFGAMVNESVKSAIWDDTRRVHLARHLAAGNTEPDETIAGWIAEYEAILRNHDIVVDGKVDLGDGIHRVNATDLQVDMTTLMFRLYREGARVVALEGEAFVPARQAKEVLVAFGTDDKSIDLMAIVRAAGVTPLGGFAQKVNVALADEAAAIAAIRAALRA